MSRVRRTGVAIFKAEIASLDLVPLEFHGEWNYAVHPRELEHTFTC
jgi:hypothetical protein